MYFTENLDKEALVLIKSDSDIKESYEAIKILSDDFQTKQEALGAVVGGTTEHERRSAARRAAMASRP